MAAFPHTLGPGHIFVRFRQITGFGSPTGTNYLGTCEITPVIQVEQARVEMKNDLAGRTYPFQKVEDGERHTYTATLNRFDYTIWKALRDTYYHRQAIAVHGTDDRWKRGSLHIGFGDVILIHVNGFQGLAGDAHPLALPEQPLGRMYFSAELAAFTEDPSANRVQTIAAAFKCDASYDAANQELDLYSEDPTVLQANGPYVVN